MQKFLLLLIILVISISFVSAQDKIEFNVETIENEQLVFTEINKKGPVLVNFWALWCKPCRAEMRHLENLYEKYKDKGFTIIGVNQDTPRSLAKVKSFVSTHGVNFPIALDPDQEIFQQFNGQSIPLSVLYNSKGEVVYKHVGYLPGDEIELEENIKNVLGIEN